MSHQRMFKRIMSIIIMGTCCMVGYGQQVEDFVTALLKQYPEARLLDVYKSCFQDYMGAEHLVSDTASVRSYLEHELATTDIEDLMPWYWEPCGINGNYVRVSLRAVLEGFIPADTLLDAFIASANGGEQPSVQSWTERWHDIIKIIEGMGRTIPHYEQDKQFIEGVLSQGQYAISHSQAYREAYHPHYRIVSRSIFNRDIQPLLPQHCCE